MLSAIYVVRCPLSYLLNFTTSSVSLPTDTYRPYSLKLFIILAAEGGRKIRRKLFSIHAVVLMAAPPFKSQPLHNFSLPHLKWAHKNSSSSVPGSTFYEHRSRRRDSPDQHHHSNHGADVDADPETGSTNPKKQPTTASQLNDVGCAEEEENGEGNPWNLRPRKEVMKVASNSKKETAAVNNNNKNISNANGVKSQRLRGSVEGGQLNGGVERKEKRKLWISLSREEIEEDVYALTGGKPARRPRKWPKNVQKQLDCVFPGLYLMGFSPHSYRVHDALRGGFDANMEIAKHVVCCNGTSVEASRLRLGADLMPVVCF